MHYLTRMITLKLENKTEGNNNILNSNIPNPGQYSTMIRASAFENDKLLVSLLYPISIKLDIPMPKLPNKVLSSNNNKDNSFPNTQQNPLAVYGEVRQVSTSCCNWFNRIYYIW